MGKGGRKQKMKMNFAARRREKQENADEADKRPQRAYQDIVKDNKDFENYYKMQKIVPEGEWDAFYNKMKENLPTSFRITGSKGEAKALLNIIKGDFFKQILNAKLNEEPEEERKEEEVKPHCLPFYPDELAWQLQLTRKDIRRSEAYFRLHNFLIAETKSGSISRQEVVSMIPPLVLDVKPWHKVLDMCAAPGSKTAQLIEMVHADEKNAIPEGFVVANDVDNNRCYMLVHQAKRLKSPNILIMNHDSSVLPNLEFTKEDGSKGNLKFDRILADVPCSGDGTMRKNPDIWCKWSVANGNNLHGIQYRIAKRGLELLEIGGRMVYSTCSLNPLENEAVVHRLLAEAGDSVHLVDGRHLVPGLVCNPGMSHWQTATKDSKVYSSWEEVPAQWQTQIRGKMFPPKPEDAEKYHLERCMRVLPHHQDTGGFFVAVLEKVKALPWESVGEDKVGEGGETTENPNSKKRPNEDEKSMPQRKRRRAYGFKEDPFVFFKDDSEEIWPCIKKFYSISDKLDPKCLLVRCLEGKKKNVYLTSPAIRDLLLSNEHHVKFINTGVKTFVRCDNRNTTCPFRLAQEGIESVYDVVGKERVALVPKQDLIRLLQNDNPQLPTEITSLSLETRTQLENLESGSCILRYEEGSGESDLKLTLVGWKGARSLRAYIPLHESVHHLRILGEDCSKFEKNKFQENRNALASKVEEQDEQKVQDAEGMQVDEGILMDAEDAPCTEQGDS